MNIHKNVLDIFQLLFRNQFGVNFKHYIELKPEASKRRIFRLSSNNSVCIGIYNKDIKENLAFVKFSEAFKKNGFNVPEIFGLYKNQKYYLEEDLGDLSLFKFSMSKDTNKKDILKYYEKALKDLVEIQTEAPKFIDFTYCFQTEWFGIDQIITDQKRFYENFVRQFIEEKVNLELMYSCFNSLLEKLNNRDFYFVFRDFQPRNIKIKDGKLYYIDYQAGRKGPLQYDVASFLYSGSLIDLTDEERNKLLKLYLKEIKQKTGIKSTDFLKTFYYYCVIRLFQTLGSYGMLHKERRARNPLKKIPVAFENLKKINSEIKLKPINNFIEHLTSIEIPEVQRLQTEN